MSLQPRHVFGLNGGPLFCFADEGAVAYAAGHYAVVHQADSRTQRFVPASPESQGITALAVCHAKKLLALAERCGDRPTVTVFDLQTLKRRKVLTLAESGAKEFVSLAFSGDGKYLAAQGGTPDWTLALWVWEKGKLVATAHTTSQPGQTAVQCLFQPGDDAQHVSVVGEGTFKVFRIEAGNSLKLLPSAVAKREAQAFTCHAWLVDNDARESLVVGTADGEVLVVQEGEVRQALQLDGGAGVTSLAAFSKGFVAGGTTGSLSLIARESDAKPYRLERSCQVEGAAGAAGPSAQPAAGTGAAAGEAGGAPAAAAAPAGAATAAGTHVVALAASPADDGVACLTSTNQLLMLSITSGEKKGFYCSLQELAPAFHTADITGLATCVRRPLVASASTDGTLRVWNWQDQSSELVKRFDTEPLSLALHPTGYMLLAGFADKLRLMTLLADDVRLVKEFPIKGCRDCCFSNGGQYFAAVNSNTVHVYSVYTCASVAVLRGHNGKVRSLWWSADDTALVTAGVDGAIYEWRVLEGRRVRDFVQKGWAYNCAVGTHGSISNPSGLASGGPSSILAGVGDHKLRVLEDTSAGGLSVVQEVDVGAALTHVVAPPAGGRMLFAADEEGCVRAYKLPLAASTTAAGGSAGGAAECQSQRCAAGGGISRLAVTHDEALLFAATRDGCVFVYDVKDRDPARLLARKEGEGAVPFSEEVLAGRGDIDDKRMRMAELEAQVAEVTANNEYQLKLRDLALNEKVRELTERAEAEAAAAKERYDELLISKNDLEASYEDRLNKAEEKYQAQLAALDAQYQQKIIAEMERYQELARERDAVNRRWEAETAALVKQHARGVEEVKADYERRLVEHEQHHAGLQEEMQLLGRECKELQRQTEEDADREVEDLKEKWQKQVLAEKEACLRLKGENGLLRKRYDEQQKAVEDVRALLRCAEGDKRQLAQVIEGLHRDMEALHKEVASRDDAIAEKEKRILDLKRKTQELEKFKFVLEYKISELRSQVDPKDLELADMRARIQELEGEKAVLRKAQQDAELGTSEHRLREAGLQKEVQRQRLALAEAKRQLRQAQHDIHAVGQHILSPEQLKAAMVSLYQRHALGEEPVATSSKGPAGPAGAGAAGGGDATARQQALLEHTVDALRKKVEDDRRLAAAAHRRLVAENAELVREINEQRREAKALRDQLRAAAEGVKPAAPRSPKVHISATAK